MKRGILILFIYFSLIYPINDSLSSKLKSIIQIYNMYDKYNDEQIKEISRLLDIASMRYKQSYYKLLSQIAIESGFDPNHIYYNTDGSYDIGLMQNNSYYVQERCYKLLKRDCLSSELKDPVISVRLAFYRYEECKQYPTDSFLICYNSETKAKKYNTSGYYPEYLEKLYREYEYIIKELQ